MKKYLFFLSLIFYFLTLFHPLPALALKINDEKIKEIISKIMKGSENPVSEADQAKALKDYEVFLNQIEITKSEQIEALLRLGHLIMSLEENEEEEILNNPKTLTPHHKVHSFSISIYEKIRANSALIPPDDELLYQLAHGYDEANQTEKSLSLLHELVNRFPKSRYYPEARFRIGESYFEEGKYPEATESYMKALESNPPRPLIDFISYKLIWSYFKMGDYRKTVDLVMTSLNRYSVQQKNGVTVLDIESLSDTNWKQVKELIHLAILSIDFWGGAEKASSYFNFHGHVSYENLIYRPLGHLYLNRGKFPEAAEAFKTFLSLYPTHEAAPQFQLDLIETYQKSENWELAKQARTTLIENYKPGTPWWETNNRKARERVTLLRKEILFQQAQAFHGEAQKSKRKEDYLMAISAYQNFLSNFPKEMEAPRIQYFLGEAFFETEQFEQAAASYEASAYQYALHLYSQEAGYAALISYEKAILKSQNPSDTLRLTLLKSCQTFLKAFPDSPKKQTVLFKAMLLEFQAGNNNDGKVYARKILEASTDAISPKVVIQSHYWLAKSFLDERDYVMAETEFKETLSWIKKTGYHDPDGPGPEELKTYLSSILYKRADAFKNQLKWKEAGVAYFHVYEEYPESKIAPVSLMNSGSAFLEAKDLDSALNSFKVVASHFPESPHFLEAESALTSIYEKKNELNEAAGGYEILIQNSPDPGKKNHYYDRLYSLYYQANNWEKLNQLLEGPLKSHNLNNVKWLYFYAVSAKELKKEPEILSAVEVSLSLFNQKAIHDDEAEEWILKSLLLKGEILYRQFVSVTLNPPLEKSLPVKKGKLKEAMDTYTKAAESKYPEIASEALYHIGNLFERFASDLALSERPKDLTPEQGEIYEGLLKRQIDPLYQKAIEVYQKNLTLSNQVENDWIRRSEARFRQLILEKKGTPS